MTENAVAALGAALAAVLASRFDDDVELHDLHRLSGGASRETWAVDAELAGAPLPLILQRTRGGDAPMGIAMETEAALLRAAAHAGVRVPVVVVAAGDAVADGLPDEVSAGLGGAWILLHRVDGEALPARLLRRDEWAGPRARMIADCGAALAAIHRIPPDAAPGLIATDPMVRYLEVLDGLGDPHPAFELAIAWLDTHRPTPPADPAVVHGDFRTGNLLVGPDGLAAVLDWELAHLGDPVEDLGWFCTRAWRFGSPLPAGGFGTREDLVDAYVAAGGAPVDPQRLRWWEVMGTLSWGVIAMVQAATHRLGAARSVELAAIGRRVCEAELDVLRLLPGPDPDSDPEPAAPAHSGPPAVAPGPGLQGLPTAAELVQATREWIEADVAEATTGRVRYHARVAANVLAMVERELELGPALAAAHAARLSRLGVVDDAALAAAIRSGRLADRRDEVMTAVGAAVLDKLSVAHPGYADDDVPQA